MLFVPQAPAMDNAHAGYPMDARYMVCMMSQQGYADGSHVLMPEMGGAARPVLPSDVPPGEWGAAKASTAKSMTIRNPETGEVIGSKPDEETSRSAKDVKKLQGTTKREVLTRRMRAARWCADHSTFSALNIEGVKHTQASRSLIGELAASRSKGLFAVASSATSLPRVIPVPASASMLKSELTKPLGGVTEKSEEEEELATKKGEELASGDDTLAALGKSSSTKRPWKPKFLKDASGLERTADEGQPRQTSQASTAAGTAVPEDGGLESAPESEVSLGTSRNIEELAATGADCRTEIDTTGQPSSASMDRSFLLAYRSVVSELPPAEIDNLTTKEVNQKPVQIEVDRPPLPNAAMKIEATVQDTPSASDRAVFGSNRKNSDARSSKTPKSTRALSDMMLTPSDKAYRTPKSKEAGLSFVSRDEELRRLVKSFLNKICPENVQTIVEKLAQIQVNDAQELELLITLIFKKALAEPHYCETYADLVFALKSSFAEFPPGPDGAKPITFKSLLLNICQSEFEALPNILDPTEDDENITDPEEIEFRRKQRKNRVLANMKFIGHLFLRQLLSAKVIGSVIQELVLCDNEDQVPEEHVIECTLELLLNIGYTLETIPFGAQSLTQVCGRLRDLKGRKRATGQGVYSRRIQFAIQDLLETRGAGWTKKLFKETAKTKEEIRLEQKRDEQAAAHGKEAKKAEHVVAGMRPQYIEERKK